MRETERQRQGEADTRMQPVPGPTFSAWEPKLPFLLPKSVGIGYLAFVTEPILTYSGLKTFFGQKTAVWLKRDDDVSENVFLHCVELRDGKLLTRC